MLLLPLALVSAQNAEFSGLVNQVENMPLLGANVFLQGTTLGTATNNKGEFLMKNLQPGKYTVVVSFSGFHSQQMDIQLSEGSNTMDFTLEEAVNNLGEIVITGTGTAHSLKNAPVPTEVFSNKAVESTGAADFTELMTKLSPSFVFSPSTMGSFIHLNGLDNNFILILIDGKRLYGDVGGMNDLNRINPDQVERIEVLKGASSLLYGSDAIAGVVNIITKKSRQKLHFSNISRYRSYKTCQQSNLLNLNLGRISWNSSFATKGCDGWQLSEFEEDDDTLVETDAMAQNKYRDRSLGSNLTVQATDKLELNISGSFYQKDLFFPETVKSYGYYYEDRTFGGGAKYHFKTDDYISLDYHQDRYKYYYKYNQDYQDYVSGDKSINNDQQLDNVMLKYINTFPENNKLTLGADYKNECMISANRLEEGEAHAYTMSFYAQDELTVLKQLDIVAGLRYVNHKEFGSGLTPKVSLMYRLKDFNLRATYGHGFKAPTLKELYIRYEKRGTLYLGNTDLESQKSRFYSAGVEYNNNYLSTGITGYVNRVDGLIAYESVDLQPGDEENGIKRRRRNYNVDQVRSRGIDFMANVHMGYGFTFGGGYSFVDAMDLTNDLRLEGVPMNYGNLRLVYDHLWKVYSLNANILGRIQDEKFYDDGNARAYRLWKLTTNHRFTGLGKFILELSAGIDNLFDFVDNSPFGSHYASLSPGRTYFIGLKLDFAH